MTVGVLIIDIMIQSSTSLKEKRIVLNSVRDKLKHKFNGLEMSVYNKFKKNCEQRKTV